MTKAWLDNAGKKREANLWRVQNGRKGHNKGHNTSKTLTFMFHQESNHFKHSISNASRKPIQGESFTIRFGWGLNVTRLMLIWSCMGGSTISHAPLDKPLPSVDMWMIALFSHCTPSKKAAPLTKPSYDVLLTYPWRQLCANLQDGVPCAARRYCARKTLGIVVWNTTTSN